MKVAIVGLGPSHDDVPWKEWETWGLPWDAWSPRYDALFEMHDRSLFETRSGSYTDDLITSNIPTYMQKKHGDIPMSREYPLRKVSALVGDYYGSSIAYMIALAIYLDYSEIGLWGVELSNDYDHQRPNLEYLLGFAKGRGIKVNVSGGRLLSRRKTDVYQKLGVLYPQRYGEL